jgi:hypothetical protein
MGAAMARGGNALNSRALVVGLIAAISASAFAGRPTFYRPYKESANNFLYNLLFCDDLSLFRSKGSAPATGPIAVLLSPHPPAQEIERIASDETEESRIRILAFNYLRSKNVKVPGGQLLGVVVEVPLGGSLDALAVFADGRIRYLNHSGKVAAFEATPATMEHDRQRLMQASANAVARIGPWDKPRLPPPAEGKVRLTFLVSDGLYFGEGPSSAIARDAIGGPVLQSATQLLLKIVAATTN